MAASNLVIRVGTAVVGVPAILALLYWGPSWGWFLFIAAAAAVGSLELFGMTHPKDRLAQAMGVLSTLVVATCLYLYSEKPSVLLTVFLLLPLVSMLLSLWRLGEMSTVALRVTAGSFGPLYVGGGLTTLALMREQQPGYAGPGFVVLSLALAWLSDTGGYFAGKTFGKHKLYAAVSPKKTVEGAIGGLIATTAGAVLAHYTILPSLPLFHAILLGTVGAFLGQLGDLGESLLKRSTGIKDSGAIVPGHGGILDRADALLVTATIVYLYTRWFAS